MSVRRDFWWNTAAGVINASEAVIMTMVTTRMGTIEESGVLSISFAVGNLMMTIGKFGARVFHSTDIKRAFEYGMYLRERFLTLCAMALVLAAYIVMQMSWGNWDTEKILSVLFICGIYMVESFEDCVWGELQRDGYLYVGGEMFIARWVGILICFTVVMKMRGDLLLALGASLVLSVIIFIACIIRVHNKRYLKEDAAGHEMGWRKLLILIRQTIPFFLSAFCVLYLNNAPKFAIDSMLSDKEQACFGFVTMPVFVITLLNQFVYQPYLAALSKEWNGGEITSFRRRIQRQILVLTGISCICVLAAALVGIPVLSWIYSMDLSEYWFELVILQMAGIFLALSGYFTVILTIMREGRKLLAGYFVTLITSLAIMGDITGTHGTMGASVGYLILMMELCIFYIIAYGLIIKRRGSNHEQVE